MLVLADSPNKLTGAATLIKAIAQRDNLMGGWDRVVVLGWNFEPSIEYIGLDTSRVKAGYRKVIDAIARDDFRAAQVKKLASLTHGKWH